MYETYGGEIRMCTFNVNLTRAGMDLITGSLRRGKNDLGILCFQEINVVEKVFPYRTVEKCGFPCAVYRQKGYNGVAICSKIPLEDAEKWGVCL